MAAKQDNRSDGELVRVVRAGEREAYAVLVDRYLSDVYSVVVRVVGHAADAEDVTQDAFLRTFQRLHLFDPGHSFRNWLLKIATNLALNRLRSRRRERVLPFGDVGDAPDVRVRRDRKVDVPGPREWAYWLGRLDESQRAAIVLFHFSEMSYRDVAEVLSMPVNTVKTHLHRGRKRLRELMRERTFPENGSWNVAIQNG